MDRSKGDKIRGHKNNCRVHPRVICWIWGSRQNCLDGGGENKGVARGLMRRYNTRNVPIAAYHPQSNGSTERGHQQIKHLPTMLWADRVTTRRSTGFAPYKLVFGQDCVLPVETEAMTWAMIDWKWVQTREQLLAARAKQFERREDDLEIVAGRLRTSGQANKDKRWKKTQGMLKKGDMVLLYNSRLDKRGQKSWTIGGTGHIKEMRGTYLLAELDGTLLDGVYSGEKLKVTRNFIPSNPFDLHLVEMTSLC